MVKATVEINEKGNRVINVVKALKGFKNRDQALNFILSEYEEELEPEIRPEYVKKIRKIEKEGKFMSFDSFSDLKKSIENA